MSVARGLRSRVVSLLLGDGWRRWRRRLAELARRLRGRRHVVSVFLELDDPYSYLLCHYLPEFERHYDVELRLYLTEALTGALRPVPQLYTEYAQNDCRRVAAELGIRFLDAGRTPPVEHRRALLDALVARSAGERCGTELIDAIVAYWRGDSAAVARLADERGDPAATAKHLAGNQRRLKRLGHYDTAMLHYAGEWYRGVDRLHYLTGRLDALGAAREQGLAPRIASIRQVMHLDLPARPPAAASALPGIELFHSFRSPYSYLALERVYRIADAFGIGLVIRPVLPMVMRGMAVPRAKQRYIVMDAHREARRLGIPFGRIADPLGPGVERLMAAMHYARSERRDREFALSAGRAVWAKGIDVSSDDGLRRVTAKAGLFWPEVLDALKDDTWREAAEENCETMMASGAWGVPTIRVGDWVCWGQDRDWLVARHLEECCDSGEGILI